MKFRTVLSLDRTPRIVRTSGGHIKESDLNAFIAVEPMRWTKTLHEAAHTTMPVVDEDTGHHSSRPLEVVTCEEALAQARAALVALVQLLFPEGQPIAPRLIYGWQTFPLAETNDLLRHADADLEHAWIIHARGGRHRNW